MKNSELDLDSHTTPLDPLDEKQEGEETLVTDSDEEEPTWAKIPFLHTPHKKIPKKAKEQKALIKAQQDILKFNRMGTHLANERTLLAWIRTAVSLFGLGTAFVRVPEIQDIVVGSVMMVLGVLTFAIGSLRYFTLKRGLEDPEIHGFHRVGIKYYVGLCAVCLLAVLVERFYDSLAAFISNNTDGK